MNDVVVMLHTAARLKLIEYDFKIDVGRDVALDLLQQFWLLSLKFLCNPFLKWEYENVKKHDEKENHNKCIADKSTNLWLTL